MSDDLNQKKGLKAHVHRFRNMVAISVGDGSTIYLTPRQAQRLGRALYRANRDVEKHCFQKSEFIPETIEID